MFAARLTPEQERWRSETRAVLVDLTQALAELAAPESDVATVRRAAAQLDELFLLVVAGEFNAGKSAFINALLGAAILEEGVTPTTTRINLIRWGPELRRERTEVALDEVTAPVELLREIHLVDTPGTNAILRDHEAITRDFVPRSDLVLFVTSADRPFSESERDFLAGIRAWGKKIVVVVNKLDILERAEDVVRIREFIAEHAKALLGFQPEIHFVSARQALRAKLANDAEALAASGFPALEGFLASSLDPTARLRLKLQNPLGVVTHLTTRHGADTAQRRELLRADLVVIDDVERQLDLYREDMGREFRFRLADVDNVLHELEQRGLAFYDETLRLGRVLVLLDKQRLKADFARQVVADLGETIARRVGEIIDWMVAADLRQWQSVTEHVAARRQAHAERIIGHTAPFDLDRARLLDSVGRAAQRTVESYDRDAEASRMAAAMSSAVASTALVGMGAVGLGVTLSHLLAGAAADATGVLAASVVAVLGLFILPSRREAAKRELRATITGLRERLMTALTAQFDRELERSLRQIGEAVAPYGRFVRAERSKLEATQTVLATLADRAARLANQVAADPQ